MWEWHKEASLGPRDLSEEGVEAGNTLWDRAGARHCRHLLLVQQYVGTLRPLSEKVGGDGEAVA